MTNVEIYDTSNSELSSDEYSHEEDDDALMEAAVSKQASPGSSPIKKGAGAVAKPKSKPSSGNPDDENLAAADAAGNDQIAEAAAMVGQEPPSTKAEGIRQIRKLQAAPFQKAFIFYKRRSFMWLKEGDERDENYRFKIKRNRAYVSRSRYASYSRSVSYSRSNSRSLSRSRSRSLDRSYSSDRSRSLSHSPELICLDDTENEDSPEKPEEAKAANVTPIKENKAKIIKPPPAQPQFEQLENEKSNENGTSSVLAEFLMIKEPKQPSQAGIELNKLTASLELEEPIPDTTLLHHKEEVQEAADEPMAMDVTLKRRRSVTPPVTNEKSSIVDDDDDDDTIEYMPAAAQNLVDPTPVLKMQPSKLPLKASVAVSTANPIQSQPAFKLSSPYTLAPSRGPNAKQNINLATLSDSLNTPTPPAVPMEISFPTEELPQITKSNLAMALPEEPAPSVTVPVYGAPSYAAQLQWAPPPQPAHAHVISQQDIAAQSNPPMQSANSGALQAPFGTQRVLPANVVPFRGLQPPTRAPLQVNSPRAAASQPAYPPRPTDSTRTATPLRAAPPQQQPPAQVQQEQAPVPVNVTSFAVPQQPQPRRSETVSTQTQAAQPEPSSSSGRQKSAAPDLKNSDANFHYRLKELFPELDSIMKEKLDSVGPDTKSVIEDVDADVKTLDKLLAEKEDEWNRLFHLRCMKMELRGRMERMERVSFLKKLIPTVISKSCSTSELREMQQTLLGDHLFKLQSRSGPFTIEECLNKLEVNLTEIQNLRGALGLKTKAPAANLSRLEEKHQQQHYKRSSLPVNQAFIHQFQDDIEAKQEQLEGERDCDLPPVNKRPRLQRPQDRYAHEMTNSTPNLANSSFFNNLTVPGKQSLYSYASAMDKFFETESQIKPLYNSSPMVSQRNPVNSQYDELNSTSFRNEEKEEVEFLRTSSKAKGLQNSKRKKFSTSNGKEAKVCQNCQVYEAIYLCTSCQNQWYCSPKCQLAAWDSHKIYCEK